MSLSQATTTLKSRKNCKYTEILGSPIAFHRVYATIAGSASAGLFLSQAMYWDSRTNDPEGWFHRTYEQWTSETALNRYELDKIRNHLTSINVLEAQLKGSPAQLHYRINHEVLNDFFISIKEGSFTSVRPKNKHPKQHLYICQSVDRQQTESGCLSSTNKFAEGQQTSLLTVSNPNCSPSTNYIYIELETNLEIITESASSNLDLSPTSVRVCDPKQNDLTFQLHQDQPTPKSLTVLLNQPDSSPQNQDQPTSKSLTTLLNQPDSSSQADNPSSRPSIAAGSFDKNEQSKKDPYKSAQNVEELIEAWITDPTTFASDCVPVLVREKIKWSRWVLPWRSRERKLHPQYQNFNPIVVDLVAVELASSASCTKDEKITHAISVMNTWEKTKGGWTNLMQRYQQALNKQQRHTPPTHPNPNPSAKANISLSQAIAQDEQRRQQEQAKQTPSALPQHTSETLNIKEKLFSLANTQKARPSSTLSAAALLEVEAQLKQALGA